MEVGGQHHASGRFTPGNNPVLIVLEAGWTPGPVWSCAENFDPTGIRSLDRPACSGSLYRLSYPGRIEMSTRNISWGVKTAGAYGWQPYHLHVPIVLKNLGASTCWNPLGLYRPLMGLLYLFTSWLRPRKWTKHFWKFCIHFPRHHTAQPIRLQYKTIMAPIPHPEKLNALN